MQPMAWHSGHYSKGPKKSKIIRTEFFESWDDDDDDDNDDDDGDDDDDDDDNDDDDDGDDHHGQLRWQFKVWAKAACVFNLKW